MVLRRALCRLASTPAFTVGTVGGAAPGTGVTLAVFTILNALALKTLPAGDSGRLVASRSRTSWGEPAALPRPLFDALYRIGGPKSD